MPLLPCLTSRRQWLQHVSLLAAGAAAPVWAQPVAASRGLMVAQLVDFSSEQQDVSKDFLIGARAAWQDINAHGGIRGRRVEHVAVETDGTPASLRSALASLKKDPSCVVLSGDRKSVV